MPIPFETSLTLTRPSGAGSYVSGVWTPAADTTVSIMANVLPPTGRGEAMIDAYGQIGGTNQKGVLDVISEQQLIAADEDAETRGDRFEWQGKTYEVTRVNYFSAVIPHYEATCKQVDDKEP